jgi:hypothetical protein
MRWEKQGAYVSMIAELGLSFNEIFLQWLYRVRDKIRDCTGKDMPIGADSLF